MTDAETTTVVNLIVLTILGATPPTSFAPSAGTMSFSATQFSLPKTPSDGLSRRDKAFIDIVVSVVFLALILPGIIL